jgi:hypothetical protein
MSPAERRVVHFFQQNREEVLIASAAALAVKAETSDATVVRATKALGFAGLDELRRTLAAELRSSLSAADRLSRTLGEIGDDLQAAFDVTLNIHVNALESLRRDISPEQFRTAVTRLVDARRVLVFGIGPSSAMAEYFVIQLARFGLDAASTPLTRPPVDCSSVLLGVIRETFKLSGNPGVSATEGRWEGRCRGITERTLIMKGADHGPEKTVARPRNLQCDSEPQRMCDL